MGWGRKWPERKPRPKVKILSADQKLEIFEKLEKGIISSPVLLFLGIHVKILRGRFYYNRIWDDPPAAETIGRVTPLANTKNDLLLEVETKNGNWSEICRGTIRKIKDAIANDTKGTFHGLGALDKSIRIAKKEGLDKLQVEQKENYNFFYKSTGKKCGVQEVLYHYFNVPIDIISEPRQWYIYHRKPQIAEINARRKKILVHFMSSSFSGTEFGGICLYTTLKGKWNCFTIRPNQSNNIESSVNWLEKRKWKDWI